MDFWMSRVYSTLLNCLGYFCVNHFPPSFVWRQARSPFLDRLLQRVLPAKYTLVLFSHNDDRSIKKPPITLWIRNVRLGSDQSSRSSFEVVGATLKKKNVLFARSLRQEKSDTVFVGCDKSNHSNSSIVITRWFFCVRKAGNPKSRKKITMPMYFYVHDCWMQPMTEEGWAIFFRCFMWLHFIMFQWKFHKSMGKIVCIIIALIKTCIVEPHNTIILS